MTVKPTRSNPIAIFALTIAIATTLMVRPATASPQLVAKSDDLDSRVTEQFNVIIKDAAFHANLEIVDGQQMNAQSDGTVTVGRDEITLILKGASVSQVDLIIRLLLAHEVAHVLQFQRYGYERVRSGDKENDRLYECQADLYAGEFLTGTSDANGTLNSAIEDALETLYTIGASEEDVAALHHPSKLEREQCVRFGMAEGTAARMISIAQNTSDQTAKEEFGESALILTQKLGITGHDWDAWSLEEAKKIIHYQLSSISSISASGNSTSTQTTSDGIIGHFFVVYTNSGNDRLRVDMDVICRSAPGSDPSDVRHSKLWGAKHYLFWLSPSSQHTIQGTVACGPGSDPVTEIILPPSDESLITASPQSSG